MERLHLKSLPFMDAVVLLAPSQDGLRRLNDVRAGAVWLECRSKCEAVVFSWKRTVCSFQVKGMEADLGRGVKERLCGARTVMQLLYRSVVVKVKWNSTARGKEQVHISKLAVTLFLEIVCCVLFHPHWLLIEYSWDDVYWQTVSILSAFQSFFL